MCLRTHDSWICRTQILYAQRRDVWGFPHERVICHGSLQKRAEIVVQVLPPGHQTEIYSLTLNLWGSLVPVCSPVVTWPLHKSLHQIHDEQEGTHHLIDFDMTFCFSFSFPQLFLHTDNWNWSLKTKKPEGAPVSHLFIASDECAFQCIKKIFMACKFQSPAIGMCGKKFSFRPCPQTSNGQIGCLLFLPSSVVCCCSGSVSSVSDPGQCRHLVDKLISGKIKN